MRRTVPHDASSIPTGGRVSVCFPGSFNDFRRLPARFRLPVRQQRKDIVGIGNDEFRLFLRNHREHFGAVRLQFFVRVFQTDGDIGKQTRVGQTLLRYDPVGILRPVAFPG